MKKLCENDYLVTHRKNRYIFCEKVQSRLGDIPLNTANNIDPNKYQCNAPEYFSPSTSSAFKE